jgi:hypothetical protein
MATVYRHTQVGHTTMIILGIALAGILYWTALTPRPALIAAAVIIGLAFVLFSTLTVIVRDQTVEVFFGPGLIRRRIPLDRIREVETVRTPWYYGWGVRLTPSGWLWNVSGLGGVELRFNDGSRFRIGSDEPQRLAEVLRQQKAV